MAASEGFRSSTCWTNDSALSSAWPAKGRSKSCRGVVATLQPRIRRRGLPVDCGSLSLWSSTTGVAGSGPWGCLAIRARQAGMSRNPDRTQHRAKRQGWDGKRHLYVASRVFLHRFPPKREQRMMGRKIQFGCHPDSLFLHRLVYFCNLHHDRPCRRVCEVLSCAICRSTQVGVRTNLSFPEKTSSGALCASLGRRRGFGRLCCKGHEQWRNHKKRGLGAHHPAGNGGGERGNWPHAQARA